MHETTRLLVEQHDVFREWLLALRDERARARILVRALRLEQGNPGDAKSVGAGIMEMRIDYGPGYRVYYVPKGAGIVILLCGGDKSTQAMDIQRAKDLAADVLRI